MINFPDKIYVGVKETGEFYFSFSKFENCVEYEIKKEFLQEDDIEFYYSINE